MKQWIAGIAIITLLLTGNYSAAAAAQTHSAEITGLEKVESLNLEGVLERAINKSFNLELLQLKNGALTSKRNYLMDQAEDMESDSQGSGDVYQLPNSVSELQEKYGLSAEDQYLWLGPTIETNTVVNQLLAGVNGLGSGISAMIESQRKTMEVSIAQMNTDKKKTALSIEEAKQGVKLQMTAQYTGLLSLQKQIKLADEYLSVLDSDLVRANGLLKVGKGIQSAVDDVTRAVAKQKEQLKTLNNNYQLSIIQLCFDLGLEYNPEIAFADISETPVPTERQDTVSVLAKSYELQRAWSDIDQTDWEACYFDNENFDEDDVRDCNSDSFSNYEERYLSYVNDISETTAEKTKIDLAKKIIATYTTADNAYQAYLSKTEDATLADRKYEDMQVRYKVGIVSAYDLNKVHFQAEQAETQNELARLQYLAAFAKVTAMESGLIS